MIKAGFLETEIRKQGSYRIEMDAALDYANKAQLEVGDITNPRNKPIIMVFADDESIVSDLLTSKTKFLENDFRYEMVKRILFMNISYSQQATHQILMVLSQINLPNTRLF